MFWRLASNFGLGPCLKKNVRSAVHRWSNGPGNVLAMKTTFHLQWLVGVLLLQVDVDIYPQPWKPPDSFPWIVATTHFQYATRGRCRFASSTPAMIEIKWWVSYMKSLLVLKYIPCRDLMYSFTNALFEDGFPFPKVGIFSFLDIISLLGSKYPQPRSGPAFSCFLAPHSKISSTFSFPSSSMESFRFGNREGRVKPWTLGQWSPC